MRILFAIPFLPRNVVSVERFILGKESLSGSQGSFLLVADALAKRGHEVGLWVAGGQQVTDSKIVNFRNLADALSESWTRIVLASWEDTETYNELRKAQIKPLLWTQVHVPRNTLLQLEADSLAGIVVVSDAARLSLLHSSHHKQIGRVYNPLNPFFNTTTTAPANRYGSKAIVFCGYLGETKGAHLVLQMWPILKKQVPDAKLIMAGSGRLYRTGAPTGTFGLADPSFEEKYLVPIAEEFGGLDKSGISFLGLMTPEELRELYAQSALGFINFNWHRYTETFCCVGAEMLATELPIFSYAASALPETMGRTGGATLHNAPSISEGAQVVAKLLTNPELLATLGKRGRQFVTHTYRLESIAETWEQILHAKPDRLDSLSGKWNYSRNFRYWLEKATGITGLGKIYRTAIDRLK